MNQDKIEFIQNSLIQHGKNNDRIYIMKIGTENIVLLVNAINILANKNKYSKIFAKVHSAQTNNFFQDGYKTEAVIKGYFNGNSDAFLMVKYLSPERAVLKNKVEIDSIIETAKRKAGNSPKKKNISYEIIKCSKQHSRQMSDLYKLVFKTYPFPIDDHKYIEQTMDENITYFAAVKDEEIIALSSCETDKQVQSVEMTDFATLPQYLGNGIALELLKEMEKYMIDNNFITAYTIARSISAAMNITFAKNAYEYTGTLINNTNISGNIESMNIWVKNLLRE